MSVEIDDGYVTAAAPNADAAKNGRALVLKGKFIDLNKTEDGSLLFGKCQGSGKTPYECSCDFANPATPTHRCSCPSRQFPCKHCIGLMFAFVQSPSKFSIAEPPEDLQAKREKAEARAEKKKSTVATPKKVNKSALAKKIRAQLEGLDLLQKLSEELVSLGIGNMNAKTASEIEKQAMQLGDMYLPGAQNALRRYTSLFSDFTNSSDPQAMESIYSDAFDRLTTLYSLVKQGRTYLEKRLEDPDLKPETESRIAEWLGHAWQLAELREAGLVRQNEELLQLAFNSHDDVARGEWVDTGIWAELATGKIYTTKNYRPYRAAKHIKAEDSFYQIAQIPELFIYPGDINPRVRWEGMIFRPVTPQDLERVRSKGSVDFAATVKEIKGGLKGPLSEKQPVCLLAYHQLGLVNSTLVIEDRSGNRLALSDHGMPEEPPSLQLLRLVPSSLHRDQVLVGRFHHQLDTQLLQVKPLAIVGTTEVTRLTL